MTLKAAVYNEGVMDALSSFGVRVAADMSSRQRMPDGPEHLGAERLSRALRAEDDSYTPLADRRQPRNLDRPTRWGNPTSIEAANSLGRGVAPGGVGMFGGV